LWADVTGTFALRVDELAVLKQAARVVDTLERLDVALAGVDLVVVGSAGQQREHPLLSEARQQRAALARLLSQLKLPDADAEANLASAWGRAAARRRWAK